MGIVPSPSAQQRARKRVLPVGTGWLCARLQANLSQAKLRVSPTARRLKAHCSRMSTVGMVQTRVESTKPKTVKARAEMAPSIGGRIALDTATRRLLMTAIHPNGNPMARAVCPSEPVLCVLCSNTEMSQINWCWRVQGNQALIEAIEMKDLRI